MSKMHRREFLKFIAAIPAATGSVFLFSNDKTDTISNKSVNIESGSSDSYRIFNKVIKQALARHWNKLPIGECIGKIALMLAGTKYMANTLEGEGPEICRVDLSGMDCVTFFESVLCIARILIKGKDNFDDLVNEITFTRYREGKIIDYSSRLHYTSDWIYDNIQKGTIVDITRELGGDIFPFNVSFMSWHPQYYPALQRDPAFISKIAVIEKEINSRTYYYIPKEKISSVENMLATGDIVAFATDKEGLDYSHIGLAIREDKSVRLMHASSKYKKVILDKTIHEYIANKTSNIGITVARPLSPA